MKMTVDRRTVRFQRDDEALAEVAARRAGWLEQELDLARLFCRIDRRAAFLPAGCGSVEDLASRRGYDPRHVRDLVRLGYALEAEPELEALLRANRIGFAAACALGRLHQDPTLLEPGDAWVRWARFERLSDLNRRIRRRVESVRQGRPADVPWSAHVTRRTADDLGRCRRIASQKAGRLLTNGQLLDVLATGYLLEHDPLEQESGVRRLPPTEERPHDRTIPAEVARALEERSGGLCEFGSCEHAALETCHLVPHREGSAREVRDLVRGCRLHHKAFDAGLLRFLAWTRSEDAGGAGLPVFLAVETSEILSPKPRPAAREAWAPPAWLLRALGPRLRRRLERRIRRQEVARRGTQPAEAMPPPARRDGHARPSANQNANPSRAPPTANGP